MISFHKHIKSKQKGFTLLEIIVAITILGAGLVTIIGLFSAGLRSATASNEYSTALFLAKTKIGEIELKKAYGSAQGTFKNKEFIHYKWKILASSYPLNYNGNSLVKPKVIKITVTVFWKNGKKENNVTLSTLKTVL